MPGEAEATEIIRDKSREKAEGKELRLNRQKGHLGISDSCL
jgi:hypothetical protein